MHPTAIQSKEHGITEAWYSVPSATTVGVSYKVAVDVATGVLVCSCRARAFGNPCRHERAVLAGNGGRPTVRVQRGAGVPIGVAVGPLASAPKRAGWISRGEWLAQRAA